MGKRKLDPKPKVYFLYSAAPRNTEEVLVNNFPTKDVVDGISATMVARNGRIVCLAVRFRNEVGMGVLCAIDAGGFKKEVRVGEPGRPVTIPCTKQEFEKLLLGSDPHGACYTDMMPNEWDAREWEPAVVS
jgi:hypothetical protein